MIELVVTALTEIVMSLNIHSSWLHLMSIIVVVCLMSSPGSCAGIIGISAKLGIASHAIDENKKTEKA